MHASQAIGSEGGLFKRAQFREGAHVAHGNRRSKTIYRIIIGVCAFDPRGPRLNSPPSMGDNFGGGDQRATDWHV
jgi:hypothetical protein